MKAIVLYGPGEAHHADFNDPVLAPNSVLIEVAYCGICGSDIHKYEGQKNTHPIHYPVPLGHEISGRVKAVGSAVTRFRVGDAVTADPNWSCGHCRFCQKGLVHFCESARGVVKGMAQYVAPPQENVYHLPEGLSLRTAALAEPVSCCVHGLDLLGTRPGDKVALIGMGAIGTIMLHLLRRGGAGEIVVIEANEGKREAALRMGATAFIPAGDTQALKALEEAGDVDRVIECVGTPGVQRLALDVAGKGATVVFFGVAREGDTLPLSGYQVFSKELTIRSSFVNPHTMPRALGLLGAGAVEADSVISSVIAMDEVERELNERTHVRSGKVLVKIADWAE